MFYNSKPGNSQVTITLLALRAGSPNRRAWPVQVVSLIFLNLLLLCSASAAFARTPSQDTGWQSTSLKVFPGSANCIDGSQPDTLLYSKKDNSGGENAGTYVLNWRTGQKTTLSAVPFEVCDSYSGLLFAQEAGKVRRFSSREPKGQLVDYLPQYFAKDGSQQFYAFPFVEEGRHLVSSSDGGLTWQVRPQIISGSLVVSESDARSIYVASCPSSADCIIYYSADAGVSWQKRGVNAVRSIDVGLDQITGPAPLDYVVARQYSTAHRIVKLSTNGGITFETLGSFGANDSPSGTNPGEDIQVFYTGHSLILYSMLEDEITIKESLDGIVWKKLPLPLAVRPLEKGPDPVLRQMPNAPNSFVFSAVAAGDTQLNSWYTQDSGHSWTDLGPGRANLQITPYLPTSLLAPNASGQLEAQAFQATDKQVTTPVNAIKAAGFSYIFDTGHNWSGPIRRFWEQNGGLAQFGYPRTEPIREYNPADGKVYVVQYFERNRLEYHPELAGTKYEVLLGLLGNQLTENRHSETPFKPVANPNISGFAYFSQTGHTLAHTFKEYWEAHGGLALYGYPISEEFQEVNPDDGKTYTVQYFERNRFEYHPENKGTKYEVLLGLLGNTLLKQYGWLK